MKYTFAEIYWFKCKTRTVNAVDLSNMIFKSIYNLFNYFFILSKYFIEKFIIEKICEFKNVKHC